LLLEGAVSPIVVSLIVAACMAVVKAVANSKAALVEAIMAKAVEVAYGALSQIAPNTPNKIDDQVVIFLKAFKEYFESHGLLVTPAVEAKAVAAFKALSAQK
jgi:hypothetical protein